MVKQRLYYAGIASGAVYLLGDIVGGIVTPNYSYVRNAVSELIQSGAENRVLFSAFFFLHAVMIILFAIGLMIHHPYKKSKLTFIGAILLLVVGVSHSLSGTIFAMDPVGEEMTFPGIMHLVLVGITVLATFALFPLIALGLYRYRNWKGFMLLSFVGLLIIVGSGVASPVVIAQGIEVMGVTERITGYTFYVWLFALACLLLWEQRSSSEN